MEEEKIFPILRKFDYLWSKDPKKNFCDVIKELNNGKFEYLADSELVEKLKVIRNKYKEYESKNN